MPGEDALPTPAQVYDHVAAMLRDSRDDCNPASMRGAQPGGNAGGGDDGRRDDEDECPCEPLTIAAVIAATIGGLGDDGERTADAYADTGKVHEA